MKRVMAGKKRPDYAVDEDALKRMVAGDITALERIKGQEESPGRDSASSVASEKQERKPPVVSVRQPEGAFDTDGYRSRFLEVKLTGTKRQTYIHDSLYKAVAKVLPVIAPDMSVPMFVGSVLADHLEKYQDVINEIYNQEANQSPLEWKK